MTDRFEITWTFTPAEIFDQDLQVQENGYTLTISHGRAVAEFAPGAYEANPGIREDVQRDLENRLLGVQLVEFKAYTLNGPTTVQVQADGTRNTIIQMHGQQMMASFGIPDVLITNPSGEVVVDTRKARIERKAKAASQIANLAKSDFLLAHLLRSHRSAVNDPENELVHLYEVWDALKTELGGQNNACTLLGVPESERSRFGEVCNELPLLQGRHRGKTAAKAGVELRDATERELSDARNFAQKLILLYVEHKQTKG
jgi:hypothetical protein